MNPKVSVCVVTYNQQPFIRRCLDSIVTQHVPFEFEVVVGDDASTDGTRDIVEEFAALHPGLVRPILHDRNIGPFANYRAVHRAARGALVAHVDGDDACLPGKLGAQAAKLDRDKSLVAGFHVLEMLKPDGTPTGRHWPERAPERFDLSYLLVHHPVVGHSSMMYRRGTLDGLLAADDRFIDFRVYVELAAHGPLGFLQQVLGTYTIGIGISKTNRWLPEVLAAVDAAAPRVTEETLRRARAAHLFRASLNAFYAEDEREFTSLIEASHAACMFSPMQRAFYALRRQPRLLRLADAGYKALRRNGWIGDVKMRFRS